MENAPTGSPSSLDSVCSKLHDNTKIMWTPRQKRCYQRIMSGLTRHRSHTIRFITLTMPPMPDREMAKSWCALKERIRRRQPGFEYLKIQTSEGNGVYHILAVGGYIAQGWISANWKQITGAGIVDIRAVKFGKQHKRRLARYMICQEVAGQEFDRMSWSWGWVFKGFVKVWYALKQDLKLYASGPSLKDLLSLWHRIIQGEPWIIDGLTLQFPRSIIKDTSINFPILAH